MNPDQVAQYLREHPDFLTEHGDIFVEVTVPHPQGGQAITLAERQLHALRDKIRELEAKLVELIRYGEENDEIGAKLHRLTVGLLAADTFDTLDDALMQSLREDFAVPHVALRVWSTVVVPDGTPFEPVSEELRFQVAEMRHPQCGAPGNLEALTWFGDAAAHIRSVALVPLRADGQVIGLLALASEESERFYAEMGTLYLSRLGELVAAGLRRILG
tara:strand:+ start:762 stop:1412 length:651 start_codon:yes stop_codon:yes gene_type:complete